MREMDLEVLRLAATGASRADTAEHLGLSLRSVDRHLQSARDELQVPTTVQAAVAAVHRGLI